MSRTQPSIGPLGVLLIILAIVAFGWFVVRPFLPKPKPQPTLRITEHWPDGRTKTQRHNAPFPPCTNPITVTPCNGTFQEKREGNQ